MFDLVICKRGRKCGMCSRAITQGEKFFIQKMWMKDLTYPVSKNVCPQCARSMCDDEFLEFLSNLYKSLVKSKEKWDIRNPDKDGGESLGF